MHPIQYAGETVKSKLTKVGAQVGKEDCSRTATAEAARPPACLDLGTSWSPSLSFIPHGSEPLFVVMLALQVEKEGAHALVVNVLDEVAWLLNVRGADVPNCPLVTSYALVERDRQADDEKASPAAVRARLFIDACKVDDDVRQHLAHNQVEVSQSASPSVDSRPQPCHACLNEWGD